MMLRKLAATGFATLVLAGCSGGGSDGTDGTAGASQAPSSNQDAAVELAKCMRANGYPAFPDPVKDDKGRWDFPTDTIGDWLPADACLPLVHAWKIVFADEAPLTAEDMAEFRAYAACMRGHGLPDFPDPDEHGDFQLPDRLEVLAANDDPALTTADQACGQKLPPKKHG